MTLHAIKNYVLTCDYPRCHEAISADMWRPDNIREATSLARQHGWRLKGYGKVWTCPDHAFHWPPFLTPDPIEKE